jgi:hypothetical protein
VQTPLAARRQAQPTGVIETLSAGYAALNRHLWVLLLPIVVDLFVWLGPHVSFSPLVDPVVTRASQWTEQAAVGPAGGLRVLGFSVELEAVRQSLIERTSALNVLSLLARGPLALPSAALDDGSTSNFAFVSDWRAGLGLLALTLVGGLLLGSWFYRVLAAASAGRRDNPLAAGRGVPRDVARVLGLLGAVAGIAVLLGLPVILLVQFTGLVAPAVGIAGSLMLLAAVLFASVHLFFAIDAIFVSNVGPLAAIQRSVGVVRRNLWPSVALILLTWLILAGMTRVWDVLATSLQSPYGTVASILGNAYIASGLILAAMIFYTERAEVEPGATSALSPS